MLLGKCERCEVRDDEILVEISRDGIVLSKQFLCLECHELLDQEGEKE
mgnify:CR=1 FL=1